MNEIFTPAETSINHGISQVFDYGIGMSCLGLFCLASVVLNIYLLWILKTILPLLGELKEAMKHAE